MSKADEQAVSSLILASSPVGASVSDVGGNAETVPLNADAASPKKRSITETRTRRLAFHRWLRLGIQLVFLIFAPGVFSAAFNGVKYLFTQIGLLSAIEPTSFVITLIAILAFTIVFGRFFCGYACAFGMLGDVVFQLVDAFCKRFKLSHPQIPERVMRIGSFVKYALLVAICLMCVFGVWSQVSDYSPWVAFAAFTSGSLSGIAPLAFILLALCVVGMAFNERFFCRTLCPLGALFSLMPVFGFSSYTRSKNDCAHKCGRCQASCPVGIYPDEDTLTQGECIACGRCADTCPLGNVNLVCIEKKSNDSEGSDAVNAVPHKAKGIKSREGYYLLRGTETSVVLIKAALLLAVCWVVGLTRYLPAFSGIFS